MRKELQNFIWMEHKYNLYFSSNFDMFFSLLINYLVIFNYIPYNIPSLCFSNRFDLASSYGIED